MPAKGDGITKRKDGRYMGRVVVHTPDGPKRKNVYGGKYKDVEKKLNKLRADADRGIVFDADDLKVGEWLDSWLSDCLKPLVAAGKLAHSSFVRYEGIVSNHLGPAFGHRKLKDLTRAEVRKLYNQKGKTLSARSVDYIHVTLQKALSQAVRDDLIARNVAAGERPRSSRQREEAKALSPAQVRALLYAASEAGHRNEALYIVAVHTGLRQGELLGLKWTDVDLNAGKLSVRRSLKVTENGLAFGSPKNKASRRSVPLNRTAVAALRSLSQDAPERREARKSRLAGHWARISQPLRLPQRPQQPLPPRVQGPLKARRSRRRGLHLPRPQAHLRNGPLRQTRAPEDRSIAARTLLDHADDGYLLARHGRNGRRRGRRSR